MLTDVVTRLVDACRRHAWRVAILALALTVALGFFVATHMRISTDINGLLSADLDWRQREQALEKAFPQKVDRLVVVIDGDSPDAADDAAARLAEAMTATPALFRDVTRPDAIPFFKKNGLLLLETNALSHALDSMIQAQPLLATLARDPSLRGLFGAMDLVIEGVKHKEVDAAQLDKPFGMLAATIDSAVQGEAKPMPWRSLMGGDASSGADTRRFILTRPVLDYDALAPGSKATAALRAMASGLNLDAAHGVRVRLTGSVALNDEEFSSVAEGTGLSGIVSVVLLVVLLYLALRSVRLIAPILLTLAVGLVATTAFALLAVGSLNLISVAFAVMFVGIAVDFGIQFGVRYRDERYHDADPARAMQATARRIAVPLATAALSTALGFFAFTPTAYRGVAELGLIAGGGMLIAYALNVTLLPALLTLFRPKAEPESVGYVWTAPIDAFLLRHRRPAMVVALALAVLGALVASQLRFDFDPLDMKDPTTESVSAMFDLIKNPRSTPYTISILEPDLATAKTVAAKIETLPEVRYALTLDSFVPKEQDKKLALVQDAAMLLQPSLMPSDQAAPPDEAETAQALRHAAAALRTMGDAPVSAAHLAKALEDAADKADPALLERLHNALIRGMVAQLDSVRTALEAAAVTDATITDDLRGDWMTSDGQALIEVYPKGDARNPDTLEAFTAAVRAVAPNASGTAISIQESARTVVRAFIQAGGYAVLTIALLALIVLRRPGDVLRLLAPLFLAGILTLATMVIIRLPLNFANIIALPLLLSLGVSYAIYFVTYWRSGGDKPLQSSMARAVLFSAATTLAAFGSLWLSSHPGTSGMGKLLTVALLYCLASTFLFLPPLLGTPRLR